MDHRDAAMYQGRQIGVRRRQCILAKKVEIGPTIGSLEHSECNISLGRADPTRDRQCKADRSGRRCENTMLIGKGSVRLLRSLLRRTDVQFDSRRIPDGVTVNARGGGTIVHDISTRRDFHGAPT